MALEKKRISEIPPDAIILSEEDAFKYQSKIIHKWKNSSDVFAFKYGSLLLGGATVISGLYLNNYFRSKYKLLHYGRMASYLPICAVPATLSVVFHNGFILKELILLRQEQCPICVELRASVLQSTLGCLLPLLLAPVSSIGLVHKYATFNMPYITNEPKKVYDLVKKQIKPIKNILFAMFIGQALIASIVTYLEADSIYKVNSKLAQLEKKLELAGQV